MLESCQRGFANREVGWSDISRGDEARTSVDHRRTADARILAQMESPHDRASASPREEGRMSNSDIPSRNEVEDLLYREAALLDEWRLEEWLELLTDDAVYQVPPTDVS